MRSPTPNPELPAAPPCTPRPDFETERPSQNVTPEPGTLLECESTSNYVKHTRFNSILSDHTPRFPGIGEGSRMLVHTNDAQGDTAEEEMAISFNPFHVRFILANTGSVARDHLSLERTFLSYVRTSLAISSAGVVLVQLFASSRTDSHVVQPAHRFARPLGSVMVIYGLIVLVVGTFRYFRVQYTLPRGYFPTSVHGMIGLSFAIGALTTVVFGILVSVVLVWAPEMLLPWPVPRCPRPKWSTKANAKGTTSYGFDMCSIIEHELTMLVALPY